MKQKAIRHFESMGARYVGVNYANVDELARTLKGGFIRETCLFRQSDASSHETCASPHVHLLT